MVSNTLRSELDKRFPDEELVKKFQLFTRYEYMQKEKIERLVKFTKLMILIAYDPKSLTTKDVKELDALLNAFIKYYYNGCGPIADHIMKNRWWPFSVSRGFTWRTARELRKRGIPGKFAEVRKRDRWFGNEKMLFEFAGDKLDRITDRITTLQMVRGLSTGVWKGLARFLAMVRVLDKQKNPIQVAAANTYAFPPKDQVTSNEKPKDIWGDIEDELPKEETAPDPKDIWGDIEDEPPKEETAPDPKDIWDIEDEPPKEDTASKKPESDKVIQSKSFGPTEQKRREIIQAVLQVAGKREDLFSRKNPLNRNPLVRNPLMPNPRHKRPWNRQR